MSNRRYKVADPIHSFVGLNEREKNVVDTQAFQRLRGLRQLQQAALVFPTATHTRFSHTLGATYVVERISRSIKRGEDELAALRLGSLVHDIGHGPFSHLFEHISLWVAPEEAFDHEAATLRVLGNDEELQDALGPKADEVQALLDPDEESHSPVIHQILSGPLDADKMDYILRDAYFTGVRGAGFDLPRLIDSLMVYNGRYLNLGRKGIHAFDQFRVGRHLLSKIVHHHHAVIAAEEMIRKAAQAAVAEDPGLRARFTTPGSAEDVRWLLEATDRSFLAWLRDQGDPRTTALLDAVDRRELYKRAGGPYTSVDLSEPFMERAATTGDLEFMRTLEEEVAQATGVKPEQVICRILRVDTQQYLSVTEERPEVETVYVQVREGGDRVEVDESGYPLTRGPDPRNRRLFVFLAHKSVQRKVRAHVRENYLSEQGRQRFPLP